LVEVTIQLALKGPCARTAVPADIPDARHRFRFGIAAGSDAKPALREPAVRCETWLPAGIGRLAALRGRTLATAAALPRATEYRAATWRTRRSAAEPCPLWSIAPCAINVLPLKAQVKDRETRSPTPHHTLKFEITFCVRGVLTPPCGTPCLPDAVNISFSRRITSPSLIRRATFSSSRWCLTVSKYARKSRSITRVFRCTIAVATRCTASCAVRLGR